MININKILLEEKNRILELHKTATKNHYLMEDTPINTSFKLDGDVTLENKSNGGDELKLFKGATFYISRKGVLYANTQWQQVNTFGNFSGKSSQGKDNVYYNCSSGKFSVGKEQKLPPCPTNDGKCKNLYYIDDEISFKKKISALCQLSQTFVKGKTIEKKIENNKNTEQVKSQEVKTPEVKTPVVQPVQTVQTPENDKIVSDVDNYDEATLAKIAAEIQ